MFLGIYWAGRRESKRDCADRIASFLVAILSVDSDLSRWYLKASSKKGARVPVDISREAIENALRSNNRDTDGQAIAELGYGLAIWNGKNASFSASVGVISPFVSNSAVLSFAGMSPTDGAFWEQLIKIAVTSFDPDTAVVTNHEYLERHCAQASDEMRGWFVYKRGMQVVESPFP